jgi:hypothetical protein
LALATGAPAPHPGPVRDALLRGGS